MVSLTAGLLAAAMIISLAAREDGRQRSPVNQSRTPPPADPPVRETTVTFASGSTMYSLLTKAGIQPAEVLKITECFSGIADVGRCRPGDVFTIVKSMDGALLSLVFQSNPLEKIKIVRHGDSWRAMREEVPHTVNLHRVAGVITGSLFETMDAIGEKDILAVSLTDILAWEIDFAHESQPGDSFIVVVESYLVEGRFAGYGQVLAAEYRTAGRSIRCLSLPFPGNLEYFNPQGESIRKSLLKSPLRFNRITSGYSSRRRHPITGEIRSHYAIDYAAPTGTPIWSVADGLVSSVGFDRASGRKVVISHPGGYESFYLHLSRYAKGIAPGKRVRQKQVIGYVGSSGLSTGPHLDYRLRRYGRFVNPITENSPRAEPVPVDRRIEFNTRAIRLLELLEGKGSESAASRTSVK